MIFEKLICSGILKKFEPKKKITDNTLLPSNSQMKKKKQKSLLKELFDDNRNIWSESYYYLTNDKFKNLPKLRFEKDKQKFQNIKNIYDEYFYFDLLVKDQLWPLFYAMDWICQISFFQHYIFHQVLYVTGATGQGKSTQVPKLFLYALKVIDYKTHGKVVCTAPRITPLLDNSTRISEELGVPIKMLSNLSSIKIKTNNFYVQYKYKDDFHTKNTNHGFIKISTDGTLLMELKNNLTLFQKVKDKFINTNIYDILFIDEAHEHNTNMDLILTLARQTCYLNNTIRLIIVSATMDDDEPIYRQYFNNINDKLIFPIKHKFHDPVLQKDILINSNYMDRRYHISPPGETVQYNINEIYQTNDFNYKIEKENAEMAQQQAYKTIIEICNKNLPGQILFFSLGRAEIIKAVQYLNSNTPNNYIALPFFSDLNENYKTIISNITTKLSTFKTKKENVAKDWGETFIEDNTTPLNIYEKAIIVATNIAEASITIDGLQHVIDNGYVKVNKYKPELDNSSLEIEKISEASRVQRKGRVGRTGDGNVYYMYTKNARANILPNYKITQENITDILLKLLSNKILDDINIDDKQNYKKLIISNLHNNYNIFNNDDNLKQKNIYTYISNLKLLYLQNYHINNNLLDKSYYEDSIIHFQNILINKDSNFSIIDQCFFVFNDGQLIDNLLDKWGCFYLIHPFEKLITRNIFNNIIIYNNQATNIIPDNAYLYLLSYLTNRNLLIYVNNTYIKTELAQICLNIKKSYNFEHIDYASCILAASAMNCENTIYELFIFMDTINYSLEKIIRDDLNWDSFITKYGKTINNSDIIFLYNIIHDLKKKFNHLLIFNLNDPNVTQLIDDKLNFLFKQYVQKMNKSILETKSNEIIDPIDIEYSSDLWNKLLAIKNSTNNLTKLTDDYKTFFLNHSEIINIFLKDIEMNKTQIKYWANLEFLNYDIIIEFLEKIIEKFINFYYKTNTDLIWCKQFNSNFLKYLDNFNSEEKILFAFVYAKPTQFTYEKKLESFISLLNHTIYSVSYSNTLVNFSNEIIFYWSYTVPETQENIPILNINILSPINIKYLIIANPILLNPFNIHPILPDSLFPSNIEIYRSRMIFDNLNFLIKSLKDYWNNNYYIWNTKEVPILHYNYQLITKKLKL